MQIFPESITSLWNDWELRVLVLLSLLWQFILIILGNRRKYSKGAFISFTVWIVYLSADWLATVSLGNLANNQGEADISKPKTESKDQLLQALWPPFLLLHLGGPDTITAYALEDNNLWLRHLLGLLVQVTVAFYIFLRSWGNNPLTFVAIPVFASGIIKYSERTYALRAASPDQFEDSLLSSALTLQAPDFNDIHQADTDDLECVHKGYFLFGLLKHLYADLSLTFVEGRQSCSLLMVQNGDEPKIRTNAFQVVEVQLGFLFNVLYTKAHVIYKWQGLVLRLVSVLSIVAALVAFHIVIDNTYPRVDVVITYFLFAGAVSLEIYAFVSLMLSDWTLQWLTKRKSDRFTNFVGPCITRCRPILCREKRWSGYIGQLNLVEFCLKKKGHIGTNLFSKICFEFNLLRKRQWKKVVADDHGELMKSDILTVLAKKYKAYKDKEFDSGRLKALLSHRGKNIVNEQEVRDLIGWSFEVEFDHSILLWHVATDICYHSYSTEGDANPKRIESKKLSDYILHILLIRPLMLPKWIDRIAHVRDTFNHAIKLFHRSKFPVKKSKEACDMLIQLHTQSQVLDVIRSERSGKSVLLDACHLALQLQNIPRDRLWETICGVWIEMLTYAASQSEWGSHAQQLRNGGELLTHVALLMADIGLSEHFVPGTKRTPVDNQNKGWGWARTKLASPDAGPLAPSGDNNV